MTAAARPRRQRLARAAIAATGLYALVLVIAPAFHHDLACHLKSPTHCTTCLVSVTGPRAQGAAGLVAADLRDAGALRLDVRGAPTAIPFCPRKGRSPPA